MSTELIGRDPLDDPLLAELRSVLDQVESQPDGWPSTMPPWEHITAGMKQTRRRRRLRRTGRVLAGTVAVTLVGAGVMTNVIPYPSFAPTVTIPAAGDHSQWVGKPTLGSLAGDPGWLNAFRRHVADGEPSAESGGELWRPPSAGDLSVLFAGDVGDYRIALVEGDWHWGPIASPQQVWYSAPRGARFDDMEKGGNDSPQDVPVQIFAPDSVSPENRTGSSASVAVLLSPRPVDVQLQAAPVIDAQARVTQELIPVPAGEPGVYTHSLEQAGSYRMLMDGRPVAWPFTVTDPQHEADQQDQLDPVEEDARRWKPLRGGPAQANVFIFANEIREVSRQDSGTGSFQLLVGADSTKDQQLAVHPYVGMITLPSGARVLGMGGRAGVGGFAEFDTATLVRAGRSADLAVAWQSTPAEFKNRPTWTAAMGPVGTSTVEWVHADKSVSSSPVTDTLAVTVRDDVRSVRFLDRHGEQLAQRPVLKATGNDPIPAVQP